MVKVAWLSTNGVWFPIVSEAWIRTLYVPSGAAAGTMQVWRYTPSVALPESRWAIRPLQPVRDEPVGPVIHAVAELTPVSSVNLHVTVNCSPATTDPGTVTSDTTGPAASPAALAGGPTATSPGINSSANRTGNMCRTVFIASLVARVRLATLAHRSCGSHAQCFSGTPPRPHQEEA
jgi:hypothetical protein